MRANLEAKSAVQLLRELRGGSLPVDAVFIAANDTKESVTLMFRVDCADSAIYLQLRDSGLFSLSTEVHHGQDLD